MEINHLGRKINTSHYNGNIDYDVVDTIRNNFYNENKDKAIQNIDKVVNKHMVKTSDIYNYYFARVANDTIVGSAKWSINEGLQSDELVQAMYNKTLINDKVYTSDDITRNFKKAIDLSGAGYFKKATQFPIKVMRELLDEFTQQGNVYYDPCCGWGTRMITSAEKGLVYIGNDVNHDLVKKLNEFGEDINKVKDFKYEIIEQGSEVYLNTLENNVDFIFTSPPYFDLEIYKGATDIPNNGYEGWLENFIRPLLENCYNYIKEGKYVAINIKNGKKHLLYNDTVRIGEEIGFKLVGERILKQNTNRTHVKGNGRTTDSSEKIMIFKKEK